MDLAAYRRSAETFVSALTGAYYRHYSGLDDVEQARLQVTKEQLGPLHQELTGAARASATADPRDQSP